jgi:hypothetical protein
MKTTQSSRKIDVNTKEHLCLDTHQGVSKESSNNPSRKCMEQINSSKKASTKEYLSTDTYAEVSKETTRNSKLHRNCPKLKN